MKKFLTAVMCVVVAALVVLGADLHTVNVGTTANDGTGDPLRVAFQKVNSNFAAVVRSLGGVATNLSLHGPMVKSGGLTLDGGGVFFNEGNPPIIEEAMGKAISFPGGVEARGLFSTNGFFNDAQGTNAYTWWAPRIAAQDGNLLLGATAADTITVVGTLVGGAYSFGPSGGNFKAAVVTNTLTTTDVTASGSVTAGAGVRHVLGTNQVTGSLTNHVVDFNAPRAALFATNDLNFTHATNLVAGRWLDAVVKIYSGATNRQVWMPAAWVQIGSSGTNYWLLGSNKVAILSLAADGDQQTNVCAVYAVQP